MGWRRHWINGFATLSPASWRCPGPTGPPSSRRSPPRWKRWCRWRWPASRTARRWCRQGGWRSLGLDEPAQRACRAFLDRYRWVQSLRRSTVTDDDAFLLRTMVVHDHRRTRLTDPDLPAALLPDDWPAADAHRLAADAYHLVSPGAWLQLRTRTGLTVPDAPPPRFTLTGCGASLLRRAACCRVRRAPGAARAGRRRVCAPAVTFDAVPIRMLAEGPAQSGDGTTTVGGFDPGRTSTAPGSHRSARRRAGVPDAAPYTRRS